jgi:hypothetical protein
MEECAAGLGGAYQRNLTHRDIKPTNILIASTGVAKLVDFGLAEITLGSTMFLERREEKSDDIAVDRTVDYAGLEKATGAKPGDVRSDIYFLGSVLFEMVTGEPLMPVTKDRQAKMAARRYMDVEDTLRKLGPGLGIPPELMRLLGKMVAYEPTLRYQNPTQLVEAIQACRAELSGQDPNAVRTRVATGPKTLFVVETNEKLRDAFRDKFKAHGYRVLITIDADQAVKRYQQMPFHALLVDAGTAGKEGVDAYKRVLREAEAMALDVAAVLILNEEQAHWAREIPENPNGVVLVRPVTMKQLIETLYEMAPPEEQTSAVSGGGE